MKGPVSTRSEPIKTFSPARTCFSASSSVFSIAGV